MNTRKDLAERAGRILFLGEAVDQHPEGADLFSVTFSGALPADDRTDQVLRRIEIAVNALACVESLRKPDLAKTDAGYVGISEIRKNPPVTRLFPALTPKRPRARKLLKTKDRPS